MAIHHIHVPWTVKRSHTAKLHSTRGHIVFVFLGGGSVLADIMKDRAEFWISKDDYNELGATKALEKLNQIDKMYM